MPRSEDRTPAARHTLVFLDGLRGLAALYVVLFHANWLMWQGYAVYLTHVQTYTIVDRLLAFAPSLSSFGHQAVLIFFILSGFVIHLRYARQAQIDPQEKFDLGLFLWRRFKRIYPTLFGALILTLILDRVGVLSLPQVQSDLSQIGQDVTYFQFAPRIMGQMTLFPSALGWGSNIPLWSLRIEWWYYLLYPLMWWVNRRSIRLSTGLVISLFLLSLIPGIWPLINVRDFFYMTLIWWLGALLAEIYVGRIVINFKRLSPLALGLVPLIFLSGLLEGFIEPIADLFWGLSFVGLFSVLFAWQQSGRSLRWLERLKPLGDMSYTLYITHLPIITFICAELMAHSPDGSRPWGYEWVVISVLVSVVSAYLLHLVIERPFQRRRLIPSGMRALEGSLPAP